MVNIDLFLSSNYRSTKIRGPINREGREVNQTENPFYTRTKKKTRNSYKRKPVDNYLSDLSVVCSFRTRITRLKLKKKKRKTAENPQAFSSSLIWLLLYECTPYTVRKRGFPYVGHRLYDYA